MSFWRLINRIILKLDCLFPEILINIRIKIFRFFNSLFNQNIILQKNLINFKHTYRHVFFGYYDITPFSRDDRKILAMMTPPIKKAPTIKDKADVGFYYINKPQEFISLGTTNTWCWQQGCRLQWHPLEENQVIYNCLIDGVYGAIIKDISTGNIIKKIRRPLYSISKNGKWGLSLNFSRLQRLRPGYGYGILPDESINELVPNNFGIELINIKTGEVQLLFSLKDVSKIEPHLSMIGAEHYFNHLMFNSSGNKFLFFHLWQKNKKRYSRIFTANLDGNNLNLLNNSGSVSHYNWISDNKIILYSYIQNKGYMYATFNDLDRTIKYFGKNIPKEDGHPTLLKKFNLLITDTYIDFCYYKKLLLYRIKNDEILNLIKFDSPVCFKGEFRCDLHPRISNDGKTICVDRIINNKRCISIFPLSYK